MHMYAMKPSRNTRLEQQINTITQSQELHRSERKRSEQVPSDSGSSQAPVSTKYGNKIQKRYVVSQPPSSNKVNQS
jgi:hypothetical protein